MITVEQLKEVLHLQPHPEGGYFTQIYRSDESIPEKALPERYAGARAYSTSIYYLLTPGTFSAMHRLQSDEIYHFYLGDPVEQLQLYPDGSGKKLTFGSLLSDGQHPQVIVPRGVWQGARLIEGGRFALMGCTVAPGFEFADFKLGERDALQVTYPEYESLIAELTR